MSLSPERLEAAVERALDQAEAQGLPRYVEDEVVLEKIARIIGPALPKPPAAGAGDRAHGAAA